MFKQSSWPVCGTVKAWEWMVVFQLAKLEFDNVNFEYSLAMRLDYSLFILKLVRGFVSSVFARNWTLGNITQMIQWDLVAYIVNSEFSIFDQHARSYFGKGFQSQEEDGRGFCQVANPERWFCLS